ncbi:MAG: PLDc N-terminal domain-containing protein [Candidatus Micrarchaeota archaeon]|nr:PLDc N-terminal domain-containing protein [Candidatus Micrarchaeota archaeon]
MVFQLATTSGSSAAGAGIAALFAGVYGGILLFYCVIGIFALLGFIGWILALVDCLKREFPVHNDKVMWILVIALTGWIGAIIYYFVVYRPAKKAEKLSNTIQTPVEKPTSVKSVQKK